MQVYPQYTLQHYYYKSFRDGGLTSGQIQLLYEASEGRQFDQMCWEAKLQGVDLRKLVKNPPTASQSNQSEALFKDPSAYEDMSQEEKDKLSQRMKSDLMKKFGSTGL